MENLKTKIKTLSFKDLIKFIHLLSSRIDAVEKRGDLVCGEVAFAKQCLMDEFKKRYREYGEDQTNYFLEMLEEASSNIIRRTNMKLNKDNLVEINIEGDRHG